MDIDSMLAFVTVVNEKSFSKAAEKLHLTQPAVTKRVQNLEQRLNVQLLERLNREIILTNAGETLLPHALSILHEFDNAVQAVKDIDRDITGTLRIVASHHIGLHRLPIILKEFSTLHPKVDLQLNFLDSESAYRLLKDNVADLAFVTIPEEIRLGFELHLEWDDPMSFVCGIEHPLCKIKKVLPKHLSEHNAILPSKSTLTYRVVETLFKTHKLTLNANIPTNYLETMKMMASVGMGWSVLPNTMIDDSLHILPVNYPPLARKLGAISYQKKHLGNSAKEFIALSEKQGNFEKA